MHDACVVTISTLGLVEAGYKVCEGWRMKEGDWRKHRINLKFHFWVNLKTFSGGGSVEVENLGMDSSEAEVREVEEDRDREEVEQVVEPWEVR